MVGLILRLTDYKLRIMVENICVIRLSSMLEMKKLKQRDVVSKNKRELWTKNTWDNAPTNGICYDPLLPFNSSLIYRVRCGPNLPRCCSIYINY